jgi:hypothetical protein
MGVVAGLDPAIHHSSKTRLKMDALVKPGHDVAKSGGVSKMIALQ